MQFRCRSRTVRTMKSSHIFETLNQSNAQLLSQSYIRRGVSLAQWSNDFDRVDYQKDHQHTLSCYLVGGDGSYRVDGRFKKTRPSGSEGAVTLMPQGSTSSWEINRPFQFGHVYFDDESIRVFAEQTFDIDPRQVELADLTFIEDAKLSEVCVRLFRLPEQSSTLRFEQQIEELFSLLVKQTTTQVQPEFRGGLSPQIKNRIREYLESHWNAALNLEDLATLAALSPFHFQKMFKVSFGCSPADFQMRLKIENAKQLLNSTLPLGVISDRCGFSNAPHFSRTFKHWVGVTPRQYRKETQVKGTSKFN